MKTIIAALVALLALSSANAADIQVQKGKSADKKNTLNIVFINGDIIAGDLAKFDKVTEKLPRGAVVMLNSYGGLLPEGLNIGLHIRRKGFRTMVGSNAYCVSVCASMWLAGTELAVASDGRIGFHGAYLMKKGKKEDDEPELVVSSEGNALVGAYLANLGYSYDAIAELTKTRPQDVDWMTGERAAKLGIHPYVLPVPPKPKSSSSTLGTTLGILNTPKSPKQAAENLEDAHKRGYIR